MLSPWNGDSRSWAQVELEDDTLREGLQCGAVGRVSVPKMEKLLRSSVQMGVTHSVVGFPVDAQSLYQVETFLHLISRENLKVRPWILARFCRQDVETARDLYKKFPQAQLGVALFKSSNPERARIEQWSQDHFEREAPVYIDILNRENISVSLNFEDATRTPASQFVSILKSLESVSVDSWALCDTVGCATPEGAERLVSFFKSQLKAEQSQKIVWHGHNDLGLAFANSLAAVRAGASVVSGTFLGIGERAGNLALEQMLAFLYFAGEKKFSLAPLKEYAQNLIEALGVDIPGNQPLLGTDVFSTHAGTHASAMIKAFQQQDVYKELVFNAFAPSVVGRESRIKAGPLSGKHALRHILSESGLPVTEQMVEDLSQHLKSKGCLMDVQEVRQWLQQ